MTKEEIRYYNALDSLKTKCREFADSIRHAARCAAQVERVDDVDAEDVLVECRHLLLGAFVEAPGMVQIFVSRSEK